ncbi:MAG: hypothetical protein WCF33_11785 [Pseudonocardiaceae bacterium]
MHQPRALLAGKHQLPPGAAQRVVGAVRELDVSGDVLCCGTRLELGKPR